MSRVLYRTSYARLLAWNELSLGERDLAATAVAVRNHAQVPYSHFQVGAALMTDTSQVFRGCNVERASYTQTSHGEQAAIDAMVASGESRTIIAMAIAAAPEGIHFNLSGGSIDEVLPWEKICPSCGHCLQIIWENCMGNPEVILLQVLPNGLVVRTTIGDALPMRFGPHSLGIDLRK